MLRRLVWAWVTILGLVGTFVSVGRAGPAPGVLLYTEPAFMTVGMGKAYLYDVRTENTATVNHPQLGTPIWSSDDQQRLYIETNPVETYFHIADRYGNPSISFKVNVPQQFTPPNNTTLRWSPDGDHLAYLTHDTTFPVQPPRLFIYTIDGHLAQTHVFTEDQTVMLYWSPNGQHLAYLALARDISTNGTARLGLFDMSNTLTESYQSLPIVDLMNFVNTVSGSWSPDGHHFAFVGGNDPNQRQTLFITTLEGEIITPPRPKTNAVQYRWSPDGSRVAYDMPQQTVDIYDVLAREVIAQIDAGPTASATPISWLPDGESLLYRWFDGEYVQSAAYYIGLFDGDAQYDLLTDVGSFPDRLIVGQETILQTNTAAYALVEGESHAEPIAILSELELIYAEWSPSNKRLLIDSFSPINLALATPKQGQYELEYISVPDGSTCCYRWHDFTGEANP